MKYSQHDLVGMVEELRAYPAEPSWLEFKTGLKDPVQIAKYISGLSNLEAKAYDDAFYMQKVLEYICAKGQATRGDIDSLLMKHLSATLTDRQKRTKIGNLLSLKLNKRFGFIQNCGNDRKSAWILTDKGVRECKRSNPGCKRTCKRIGL